MLADVVRREVAVLLVSAAVAVLLFWPEEFAWTAALVPPFCATVGVARRVPADTNTPAPSPSLSLSLMVASEPNFLSAIAVVDCDFRRVLVCLTTMFSPMSESESKSIFTFTYMAGGAGDVCLAVCFKVRADYTVKQLRTDACRSSLLMTFA